MRRYRLVDLSLSMAAFVFPGNPPLSLKGPYNRVDGDNREYVYDFQLCTQSGTHIQGAHYFSGSGKTIDAYPLERFEGWAHVVDVQPNGEDITAAQLEAALGTVEVSDGIVVLRTGAMENLLRTGAVNRRLSGLSLEGAKYLCDVKKVKLLAVDAPGLESVHSRHHEVTVYLGTRDVLILEGLCNLQALRGGQVFIEAYPLKIEGVEGTPCRAVAKVYDV